MQLIQEVAPAADVAEAYVNTRWTPWDTAAGLMIVFLAYGVPGLIAWAVLAHMGHPT